MNQNAVAKIIRAKKLEYEAVKELMPQEIREHLELSEKHMKNFVKESGVKIYKEFWTSSKEEEPKKQTKKVTID